jgi:hypothetical protein
MSYYELWAILGSWKSEFSASDFASAFSSPDPRKVLSDMTAKGLLERTERGRYRVTTPNGYVRSKYNVGEAYDVIRNAGLPYALTDVDGVLVWTRGGYNANRFFGSYPVYVKVREGDLARWEAYLAAAGKNYAVGTESRKTLYGIYYLLFPTPRLESETVGSLSVEPLKTVVEFCRRDPFTYSPALEMLDNTYSLGLNASYAAPPGPR